MEEENVVADNSNTAEEEVLETSHEEFQEETSNETESELQARLAKAEELANNYKIRAEKAERLAKVVRPTEAPKVSGDLSTKDIYALMEAKVPEEDIEVVQKFAKLENISVGEALKSGIVKTILADKAEQRNTALAANVGTSKRGSGKVAPDILLAKARKGELPTSDADIEALIQARKGK